jgi:hypothetical protein
MPLPKTTNLIPDLREMASFTSVVKDQIRVVPSKDQEAVGEYKL